MKIIRLYGSRLLFDDDHAERMSFPLPLRSMGYLPLSVAVHRRGSPRFVRFQSKAASRHGAAAERD